MTLWDLLVSCADVRVTWSEYLTGKRDARVVGRTVVLSPAMWQLYRDPDATDSELEHLLRSIGLIVIGKSEARKPAVCAAAL